MMKRTTLPIYSKNRENVIWQVPSLFHYDEILFYLLDDLRDLGIKNTIGSVYGSVRSSWGGGQPSGWVGVDREAAESIIFKHNYNNISCCFTFSNYNVEEKDLKDETANLLLDVASQGDYQNFAIVSSELLAEYIRNTYPKIKLISSMLKPIYEFDDFSETPDYYNDLCERYDRVVIRPEFSFDENFLKKLKYKNQIDIMVNYDCIPNCPISRKHYDFYSQVELGIKERSEDFCHLEKRKAQSVYNTTLMSNDDMDRVLKLGFNSFKLRGRRFTKGQVIELFGQYIFDPTGIFQNMKTRVMLKVLAN